MRKIMKIINKGKMLWSFVKVSSNNYSFNEMYGDQYGNWYVDIEA